MHYIVLYYISRWRAGGKVVAGGKVAGGMACDVAAWKRHQSSICSKCCCARTMARPVQIYMLYILLYSYYRQEKVQVHIPKTSFSDGSG